jgi:hypothetical protein
MVSHLLRYRSEDADGERLGARGVGPLARHWTLHSHGIMNAPRGSLHTTRVYPQYIAPAAPGGSAVVSPLCGVEAGESNPRPKAQTGYPRVVRRRQARGIPTMARPARTRSDQRFPPDLERFWNVRSGHYVKVTRQLHTTNNATRDQVG